MLLQNHRRVAKLLTALIVCCGACSICAAAETPDMAQGGLADRILAEAAIHGGLVVHVGCNGGRLTAELHAGDAYLVQGLDADLANVAEARSHIRSLGLYGPVSVVHFDGQSLPYADGVVNLVVSEDLGAVSMKEVLRVLAPRGVAYVKDGDSWKKTIKPRPADIDDWTHYLHAADNNAVAKDEQVGPPARLQWKSDPMWCRSHNGVGSSIALVLSSGGRLFSVVDEGLIGQPGLPDLWTLVARDAFNGKLLWKRRIAKLSKRALAVQGDRLFLISQDRELVILDATDGQTLKTCEEIEGADELLWAEGLAVVHLRSSRKEGDTIAAVDAQTGRVAWKAPAAEFEGDSLAAADAQAYYRAGGEIVCLDLHSGEEKWRARTKSTKGGVIMIYQGVVFDTGGGLKAFDSSSGEALWTGPSVSKRLGVFGAAGLIWMSDIQEPGRTFLWTPAPTIATGFDPRSGEVKRTVTANRLVTPGHHIRCYSAKATERYLLLPKRGVEFVDLKGENHMRNDWLRAPCGHGVMAANGLLYVPPHQCFCYPGVKLAGYNAVAAEKRDTERGSRGEGETRVSRLERGPAYNPTAYSLQPTASSPSWPTYRHDARRSGATESPLPDRLKTLWKRDLGGVLSQPVAADGRLLVAEEDAHSVTCLDSAGGETLWRYTAGARIDTPPTLHEGLVLFGSADGYVYCLRAADGELVWRFQAAPERQQIVVFDQLESVWPVHGSVLVQNGVAYCTAGRSSYLDGGIWVYALDPKTGRVLHERHMEGPQPDVAEVAGRPFDMEGARTDLLVGDGQDIYMFFKRFAADLTLKAAPRITKLGDREVSLHLMSNAGFLDKSWFDRNYWTYSSRWPGFYFGYDAPKVGQILVFDDDTTYGLHVFTTRQGHSPRFWPATDGYELFADDNRNEPLLRPTSIGREKGLGFSRMMPPKWSTQIPIRARAMLISPGRLYLAGPPDVVTEDDPMAAFEGRAGGLLWVVSSEDGSRLAEYRLESPPVFDGLSAAAGRLYLSARDGSLICMGEE